MEWLDQRHPEYVDRLAALARAGRIEIIGGPYYEPILTMLPSHDRVGQITAYSRWLRERLGAVVRGAWIPERVWEANLTADLADAEIEYAVLDDFHFRCAGLQDAELHGYYVTEDSGRLLKVFPGSERLRYLIPFGEPHVCVDWLREIGRQHPRAVVTFGDDGEKFGTWPETKTHVYDNGWLRRFFDALQANREWLTTTTLAEAADQVVPIGKIYLPDASYREMCEWALPAERQIEYHAATEHLKHSEHWERIQPFVRGGIWRNFRAKYPEANEMYARMLYVSDLVRRSEQEGVDESTLEGARHHLYRGQCNCAYWHGAFGGLYLPHLRNAVYRELLAAEDLLERATRQERTWVEVAARDFNLDARIEIRLGGDRLVAWLEPAAGGRLYELDIRAIGLNLLATLCRRPEAYHEKVRSGAHASAEGAASIHDRIVFKQKDLDQRLQYDSRLRKSLIDHFWPLDATPEQVRMGTARELGDFADGVYLTKIRRNPDRIQVQMTCTGLCDGRRITITKGVAMAAGSDELEIDYLLEGLPLDGAWRFGVEFNFAGLPAQADDRFFHMGLERILGPLQSRLDIVEARGLHLRDQWQGLDVGLRWEPNGGVWTFPIETVSQSEGGFELVHQSVVVIPNWEVRGDAHGRWSTAIRMNLDTSMAQSRSETSQAISSR
jgi:alpha-amylase